MALTDETSKQPWVDERGKQEFHLGVDESPWVPFIENVAIRHLAFDVRTGTAVNVLGVSAGGKLGRHRHRGPVSGYVIRGNWRYLEHDWVATPGSWIQEFPGGIHTLVCDDPNGMETVFWLNGPLEFLDDDDNVTDTFDVFWYIDHYLSHCAANGLPVNEKLFI